jgi:alpha-beta hydrolase superfamily lysophospholipase
VALPRFPDPSEAEHDDGFATSRGGVRLYWRRFRPPSPRAAIALLPGGGDHSGRYPALTHALVAAGFAVALLDFRGHGRSDGRRWHVESWDDYLADVDAVWPRAREAAPGRPAFVVAHSQGALVAIGWALRRRPPLAGMVLSSPYLGLAFRPPLVKLLAARVAGRVAPWLPVGTGLRVADLTSDEELQRWTDADPLYGRKTTPGWYAAAGVAQQEVLSRAAEIDWPLLVLAAGADRIADAARSRELVACARSRDRTYVELAGMRHEIWNERDRARSIGEAVAWLAARAPGAATETDCAAPS